MYVHCFSTRREKEYKMAASKSEATVAQFTEEEAKKAVAQSLQVVLCDCGATILGSKKACQRFPEIHVQPDADESIDPIEDPDASLYPFCRAESDLYRASECADGGLADPLEILMAREALLDDLSEEDMLASREDAYCAPEPELDPLSYASDEAIIMAQCAVRIIPITPPKHAHRCISRAEAKMHRNKHAANAGKMVFDPKRNLFITPEVRARKRENIDARETIRGNAEFFFADMHAHDRRVASLRLR